ncbi:MAG TPA: hypothetical protein VMS09_03860 [Paenibacillus sp.]|nr:hypothetical protein [Paenibacillus sp.]HUC91150.1 hypothetical protein [Paenibacillus sp.]
MQEKIINFMKVVSLLIIAICLIIILSKLDKIINALNAIAITSGNG